ncbi:MAG: pyridoxal-phosphate dependent enzyme [Candidatus Aminicenantes bacterium]|nr:pyridoxal-phosphate dependent enzyme [Candidatus Aminicenantes bacterium]
MNIMQEALSAENRIRPYIHETPLEYSRYLSRLGGCRVYLKLENTQRSGSFKFRGAANFILSLSPGEVQRGIITASTGNHGAAALSAASFIKTAERFRDKTVVLIITGKKITLDKLKEVLARGPHEDRCL